MKQFLEKHQYSEPMTLVLDLFNELPNILIINEKLKPFGMTIEDLREESIGVLIDYIEYILEDNILTHSEMDSLGILKRYLRIKEGDFLKFHKEEAIQHIIYHQMKHILEDNYVDKEEALMKTYLQSLFDLSYDQFLLFERKAIDEALKNGANLSDLDTIYYNKIKRHGISMSWFKKLLYLIRGY